jgi:hypothetical protein
MCVRYLCHLGEGRGLAPRAGAHHLSHHNTPAHAFKGKPHRIMGLPSSHSLSQSVNQSNFLRVYRKLDSIRYTFKLDSNLSIIQIWTWFETVPRCGCWFRRRHWTGLPQAPSPTITQHRKREINETTHSIFEWYYIYMNHIERNRAGAYTHIAWNL